MRVYPKATRIDSSNYNPLIGWMHGAQMVAFNMQVISLLVSLSYALARRRVFLQETTVFLLRF